MTPMGLDYDLNILFATYIHNIKKNTFDQSRHSSKKVDPRPKINTHVWGSYQFNKKYNTQYKNKTIIQVNNHEAYLQTLRA